MTTEYAKSVLYDNFTCTEGSFFEYLHECSEFSVEAFWAYYDCLATLSRLPQEEKTFELTAMVSYSYNRILTECIAHFDPNDICDIDGFPDDWYAYNERLDFAFGAYMMMNTLPDDESFELKR